MKQINDKLPLRNPELKIPEEDPFEYDLLNRKKYVEILTRLIESTTGPRVISVDAEWGNGKTTFLKMWAQHLRKQKHAVVEFNAWETDFCRNPFTALFSELEIALNNIFVKFKKGSSIRKDYDSIYEGIKSAASKINAISLGFAGLSLGIGIESNSDSMTDKNIIEYKDAIDSMKVFKCLLEQTASKLYELEYKSLVIVIDELDRCRPSYALELLENAKHIFGVNDIVFILGINRSQLEHSIDALYGNNFDAQEYARRYFDLDYKLPNPSRNDFIDNLMFKNNIEDYFNSNNNIGEFSNYDLVKQMLHIFFVDSSVSLRTIEQTIQRMGVVCALTEKDRYYITVSVVLLILKTTDSKIYEDFINENISDLELIEKLPSVKRIGHAQDYVINWFEAIVIVIEMYIKPPIQGKPQQTPLYKHYEKMNSEIVNQSGHKSKQQNYPVEVMILVENIYINCNKRGITNTIERIEFVSEELLPSEE